MAQVVTIPGTNEEAKIRLPVGVWLWGIPTGGIYHIFWWYYINDEMKHLGESKRREDLGTSATLSVVAFMAGLVVVVPLIWTVVATMRRVQRSQDAVGVRRMNGWASAALWIFTLGIGGWIYTQSNLNRIWRAVQQAPAPALTTTAERPRFDSVTGKPITGYDPQTGEPVFGERVEPDAPRQPSEPQESQ